MEPEPTNRDDSQLLPEETLPCIWMTAGILSWKLCDRDLDCQACPLDAALQGDNRRDSASQTDISGATPWKFPEDRHYHPSHGWVKSTADGRIRFGLDMFAGRLLARATSVILPPVQSQVHRDRAACWIVEDSELVPIPSPVTGTVLAINTMVQHDPSFISSSPYEEGWLFETSADAFVNSREHMIPAIEMREQSMEQLNELREYILQVTSDHADIGTTLADGGEPFTDLRRILPTDRYLALILRFLS
ncbi:glycine cleavage system protein H [Gemmatimonadota bacterium]